MPQLKELPLFPLHTVLFPGMPLPLHIFEERYKVMINQSVERASPFGVVLIRDGPEVGGPAVPYHVGTSAFVTHVERLPGGRMNISTVGYQRFRIREILPEKPYPLGVVEDFPLEETQGPIVTELVTALRPRLSAYLTALVEVLDMDYDFGSIPDDPLSLAYFTAIVLNMPADEKQNLLTAPSLRNLLETEVRLLKREASLLKFMASQELRSRSADHTSRFSEN